MLPPISTRETRTIQRNRSKHCAQLFCRPSAFLPFTLERKRAPPDAMKTADGSLPDCKISMAELSKDADKDAKKDQKAEDPPEPSGTSAQSEQRPMVVRVLLILLRLVALLSCLYFFVCSLDIMSSSFRLLGGRQVGELLANNVVFGNPIACLMIGVLLTVLVQSSSTSTSIIITMVGAGIIELRASVYMVMGANIGTTVTNTIVSFGQIGDKVEIERAFAGATVHDMFNWLTVLILLPVEAASGALTALTSLMVGRLENSTDVATPPDFLKTIVSPLTKLVIQLDSKVLKDPELLRNSSTLTKICCKKTVNGTCAAKCEYMFINVAGQWSDAVIGGILLVLSLAVLIGCLVGLVRILRSLLEDKVKVAIERVTRSSEGGCLSYLMDYVALVVGAGLTILVQSSSVLTSALTPLVGTGVITVEIMYPITLGSNIGTTTTGLLAALASADLNSLQTALTHLMFNLFGIVIWLPLPFMKRVPISLARRLGAATATYRWFAFVYILLIFFLMPLLFFGLSLLHFAAVYAAAAALVGPMLLAGLLNLLQEHRPQWLPERLRTWDFMPEPLRSLAPYDRLISRLFRCCCRSSCNKVADTTDTESADVQTEDSYCEKL